MAITKVNEVSIAVTRKTRTSDAAGGYTTTAAAITGSPFSGRIVRKKAPAFVAGGPGDAVVDQVSLIFPAGTAIRIDDICTVSSVAYKVIGIRDYSRSVQADVEAVK